jgi:hypothetical protein
MTATDKVTTWPADLPVLEATTCQLGRCSHCGSFVLMLEAQDGSRFALAHLGDDSAALARWFTDSLRDSATADRPAGDHPAPRKDKP